MSGISAINTFLAFIWGTLVNPVSTVRNPQERQLSRSIAAILFLLIVASVVVVSLRLFLGANIYPLVWIAGGGVLSLIMSYILTRYGNHMIAIMIASIQVSILIYLDSFFKLQVENTNLLLFVLVVPIAIAATFLPRYLTIMITAFNIIGAWLIIESSPQISWQAQRPTFLFVSITGVLMLLINHYYHQQHETQTNMLNKRDRELAAMRTVGGTLAATLNTTTIYRVMWHETVRWLMDVPNFAVAIFDEETQMIRYDFMVADGEEIDASKLPTVPTNNDPISETIRTGQARMIDLKKSGYQSILAKFAKEQGNAKMPRWALYMPLVSGDTVLGIFNLERYDSTPFSDNDLMVISTLSNQAAAALKNARLYTQAQQEIADRRRAEEALRQSEQKFIKIFHSNPDPILIGSLHNGQILECNLSTESLFGYNRAEILTNRIADLGTWVEEDARDQFISPLLKGKGVHNLETRMYQKAGDVIWTLVSAEPIDIDGTPSFISMVKDITERKQSEESLRRYTERLSIIHQIDQAILTAQLSETVAKTALTHLRQLIPYTRASVAEFHFDTHTASILASHADFATIMGTAATVALDSFNLEELLQGELDIQDNLWAKDDVTRQQRQLRNEGIISYISIPMVVDDELLGCVNLESDAPGAFSAEEQEIAYEAANSLAIALGQARLNQQVRTHATEMEQRVAALQKAQTAEREQRHLSETLREVVSVLNSSLESSQVLDFILEQLMRVVMYDTASVVWISDDGIELLAGKGLKPMNERNVRKWSRPLPHQQLVIESRKPLVIHDTETNPHWRRYKADITVRCWLCVPLMVQERVIGLLSLTRKEPYAYTDQDAELVMTFAFQAAIAFENAQLFEQAQQEINERMRAETALETERESLAQRVEESTAELRAANVELARVARAKDEFLASMSHELRTPLNAILGMAEILQEEIYGPITPQQLLSLETIESSGHHLLSLINDILDVAKIGAGRLEIHIESVHIPSLVNASLQLVRQAADKKGLTITCRIDELVRNIDADERRLKQILVNLLSNAVKFTPKDGQVGLEVQGYPDENVARFTVWDTGIGIAEEDLARLFRPFVQLDSRLSREYTGTGLGLVLVSSLADMHGGSVAVESDVGYGSRFTVSIPWKPLAHAISLDGSGDTVQLNNQFNGVRHEAPLDSSNSVEKMSKIKDPARLPITHNHYNNGFGPPHDGNDDVASTSTTIPTTLPAGLTTRESTVTEFGSQTEYHAQNLSAMNGAELDMSMIATDDKQSAEMDIDNTQDDVPDDVPSNPIILLAEDNEANIETLFDYLQVKGYDVVVARDGADAVQLAREVIPDLILMDIQ
ncbi:MAG: GAF domain-containing protein, partial [Chloroflexota bacterium]